MNNILGSGLGSRFVRIATIILMVSILASACSGPANYTNVTAQDVKGMLDNQEEIFLLDVHVPEQAHIKGTDAFVPFNEIEKNLGKLPADKNAKIVVYCRSGSMSQEASAELIKRGYTNVYNMEGGVYAWNAAGYSLEQ